MCILACCLATQAWSQVSTGRGAPDPLPAQQIVGSEGKGLFTGAGVPKDNHPVFATRDGAVPAGITPLPVDVFSTHDFYQDRACGAIHATSAAIRQWHRADLGRLRGAV